MKVEMEVDAGVSQAESAEIKSPKRKVIQVESGETQEYVCEMLTIKEEPFTPATITVVRERSDTGSLRRWSLQKVEKLEQ